MFIFIVFFLIGGGMIAYGVWEQKNIYSRQQFVEATVVGYLDPKEFGLSGVEATLFMVNRIAGVVSPLVQYETASGKRKQIKLHDRVSKNLFERYPELKIGGTVCITFFGDDPKEAFLVNHPLAQTVMKTSMILLCGIGILLLTVAMLLFYIYIIF